MAKPPSAALHEFFRWERQSWVEVVADVTTDEKAYFMPVETLKSYFRGNGGRKLNKILSEVFQSDDIPVDPELILRGHTAVFCILLRISKGRYIEDFAYFEELSDARLPFDPAHPPSHFPEDVDDPGFLQRFCETQWMYCVPIFDSHMLHKYFGRQRLLPITNKEQCENGGSAAIYKIKLYGPHNKLIPTGSDIQINNSDPNTFMLKRYTSKNEYRQEVKNFSNSKHSESIIKFHGSYSHGNDYNVLLEFADKGSLEEYFQKQTPPSRGADIIKFWDSLFHLIKALKAIHSFLGGHHDVRPTSVLVLSYGAESAFNWHFKLADFGTCQSGSKMASSENGTATDSKRSQPYGAPECGSSHSEDSQKQKRSSRSTQAADIWSLGCIYSEAAVWIADGYNGVVNYRRQRMAEIEKLPDLNGEDSFHDGERVLKTVLNAHKEIELRLRRSDNITKDVLDSMVEEMLWEEDRPGAKALWRRAEGILSRARQKLSSSTPEDLSIRPSSSSNRSRTHDVPLFQSPPHPPPERPLPERPRGSSSRSNSAQRQSPANVEMWRTLVRVPSRDLASSVYGGSRTGPESISEHDTDAASSTSGWQGGNRESLASAITSPLPSPHANSHFDFTRQIPVEMRGRRGPPQSRSSSLQRPSRRPYRQSPTSNYNAELSDDGSGTPSSAQLYAKYLQSGMSESPIENETSSIAFEETRTPDRDSQPTLNANITSMSIQPFQPYQSSEPVQPLQPIPPIQSTQPIQPVQSIQSIQPIRPLQPIQPIQPLQPLQPIQPVSPLPTFQPLQQVQPLQTIDCDLPPTRISDQTPPFQGPSKRFPGLSLFPSRINKNLPPAPVATTPANEQQVTYSESYSGESILNQPIKQYAQSHITAISYEKESNQSDRPLTRSDSISTRSLSTVPTSQYGIYQQSGHLSLAGVLDWKKAHKKSKKNARVPPVRGADLLDKCNDRDHVFIIDDGVAMREQWSQVKTAFEALSYVLKPMAPDGIELFFANSYDTWRRQNTTELVDLLEKKGLEGETDISYRLRLQLQAYIVKSLPISQMNLKKGKKCRPMSFYILTNGNWKDNTSPDGAIKEMADHLLLKGMEKGHVTIQFVTFGHNAPALQQINDLVFTDFGIDIVDATPSTGDVLKMLCGPLDKNYFAGGEVYSRAPSSASTLISPLAPLPLTTLPPIELA